MGARARDRGRRETELSDPRVPPLHLVATDTFARATGFERLAASLLAAGGPAVALHLRLREAGGAALFALAARLAPAARGSGARLLVNDRLDVALAAGCDGVQLGGRSMTVADARRLLGRERLVGASVHSPAEADAARGADFLLVGSLYESETHPGAAGAGPRLLESLHGSRTPLIGIGGVTPGRVAEVLAAGGAGVAVVSGIWGAPSPGAALGDYLTALGEG